MAQQPPDQQQEHHKEMNRKRRLGVHEDAHAASGAMSDINITPLIDVMLVLLIIFMVVTPLAQKGLDISLPQPPPPNQPEQQSKSNQVVMALEEDVITVNKNPVGVEELESRLRDIYQARSDKTIFVRATGDGALRPRGAGDGPRQGRGRRADRDHLGQDDRRGGRRRRRPAVERQEPLPRLRKGPARGPFHWPPGVPLAAPCVRPYSAWGIRSQSTR